MKQCKNIFTKIKHIILNLLSGIFLVLALYLLVWALNYISNNDATIIYNKNNIEVHYENSNDYIEVINNSDENVNIVIKDNYYSVGNTNNKRVKLGLNSGYGLIDITINDEIVKITYLTQ